ncbi:MAG: HigA family addiction module antitoxin [Balneolaceae bacterium]|nr:HigA family addiction module antitoxin [Balneolaceae bacterium]
MIPKNRVSTHPGTILLKEYLEQMGLTQKELADHLDIPIQRVNEIVKGKRGISPDTAWLLSEAFDTSPEFWLNLQSMHDLSANRPSKHIKSLKPVQA